ncbi:hypothetical protein G6F22_014833 [Rhizopus arrhizus]|nr:hypothetical protein G6F22_014833 [Rhizopus arrhizus]
MACTVRGAATGGMAQRRLGERDADDQAAVVQQRDLHRQQGRLLAAMHRGRGGEHAGRLARQRAVDPFGAQAIEEVLHRRSHVAESGRAAEQQALAFDQVLHAHVGGAIVGHRRLRGLGYRSHRRYRAQARGHPRHLADAPRDLARQPCHRTAPAVVQHQILAHRALFSSSSGH